MCINSFIRTSYTQYIHTYVHTTVNKRHEHSTRSIKLATEASKTKLKKLIIINVKKICIAWRILWQVECDKIICYAVAFYKRTYISTIVCLYGVYDSCTSFDSLFALWRPAKNVLLTKSLDKCVRAPSVVAAC